MFEYGLRRADRIISVSEFSHDALKTDFGHDSAVIPPIVDLKSFRVKEAVVPGPPRILFVGDVDEVRKGAGAILKALPHIRAVYPDAEFVFSGRVSEPRKQELLGLLPREQQTGVEFLGVGDQADLPELYRRSTVVILPSIWEALGMVLLESLACGTPVVGCSHGGIPNVISSPAVGRMFPSQTLDGETPNIGGLVQALLETIELARDPSSILACRERVEDFGVDRIGALIEAEYHG
jgi:glycosyltransferase involved in cell wall biosynthesis